jgi:tetratricopeptide (TPR) repeat protein
MAVVPSAEGESSPSPAPGSPPKPKKSVPAGLAFGVIALCLVVLGAIGGIVVYPQIKAAYHWRQAREAIDRFDLTAAQEHLSKCLQVWTTSGEAEFLMARTCRRAGDLETAREHLKKAKKLNWVHQQIQLEYLLIQAQTALLPWVEEKLKGLLQEGNQDDRLILEALVVSCLNSNFIKKGYQWSTVWVEQHPDDWEARFYHGSVLETSLRDEMASNELAANEFQKALQLNPDFPATHLHLAQVLLLDNRSQDALPHFQEYLKHDPTNPLALLGLARCLQSDGEPKEARAVLQKLLAAHPEAVDGYLLEAQLALEEEDNTKEAQQWLRKALDLDPDHRLSNQTMAKALLCEAAALQAENRNKEADEKLKQAKEFDDRGERIRQAYRRVKEINKELLTKRDDVVLRIEASTLLMNVGRKQEAYRWLVSALLLDPEYKPAKDAAKEFLRKYGDRQLQERYRAILEDQPNPSLKDRP